MFLFVPRRNFREKIVYFFIYSNHLMFLMLALFLTIFIFFAKTAYSGSISGRVYKYSDSTAIRDRTVTVTAYNTMNVHMGHATTRNDGTYTITGLHAFEDNDSYRVCADKPGYVIECYQKPDSTCSGRNCGYYWVVSEDPSETQGSLVDLTTKSSQSGVDFYLARGGGIRGDISEAKSGYSYQVYLEGEVEYKNREPVPNRIFPLSKTGNHFFNDPNIIGVIPPGTYTLKAEDSSSGSEFKYYTTVYYSAPNTGTYSPQNAHIFTYLLDQTTTNTANFPIRKGGYIEGSVMERFLGNLVGIDDALVTATEITLGLLLPFKYETDLVFDPNDVVYRGVFLISGLPPGTYILKTDDTPIGTATGDPNLQIYLTPQYYDNVYFENEATHIIISETDINETDYKGTHIEIRLRHSPVIKGCAMDRNTSSCSSNQYNPQDGLTGITIELVPDFQLVILGSDPVKKIQTDPNGYIFKEFKKILPGEYKLRAYDTNFEYYPTEYKPLTVDPDMEYTVNFCMEEVPPGQGDVNISGHLFLDENPDHPLSQITVGLLNTLTDDYQDTNTNNQGEYFFNSIDPGEYILFTTEKPANLDIIHELFKDVSLLDPNKFQEGSEIIETLPIFKAAASSFFLPPGENITGVDIGVSSYKYTFRSGLNLFGYPGLPVEKYDNTYDFCFQLGPAMKNFRFKDPDTGQWYIVTPPNIHKDPRQIRTGQGYIIYMRDQKGPVFYPPFKTQPPSTYQLVPGKNYIAYPSSVHRRIKKSSELLTAFGTQDEIACVKSFDNMSGKWKSTAWLWGKPGCSDFSINQGEGYIVEMKTYNTVETEPPNIAP